MYSLSFCTDSAYIIPGVEKRSRGMVERNSLHSRLFHVFWTGGVIITTRQRMSSTVCLIVLPPYPYYVCLIRVFG